MNPLLNNYAPPALYISRGQGSWVWDEDDNKYLDFTAGIAVTALGHAHPQWIAAITEQAQQIGHISNLFRHRSQEQLAQRLIQEAGPGQVFFCNSGAEANEALIKLSRLHGNSKQEGCHQVVVADNAFHGRTFGGMSATPQAKIQNGFQPLVPGFISATNNDINAFDAAITDNTAAVMLETIQGESGILPARQSFLQELRALCTERQILLMIDEVQCGIGRTGSFYAYQKAGITPDAIGMAKGLGGGFPIGAIWVQQEFAPLITPGCHGSTFGGNPLACAAALSVLDIMEQEQLMARASQLGQHIQKQIHSWIAQAPSSIQEIRGDGLMLGIGMASDPAPYVKRLREEGLLTVPAGNNTIRLLPPLTVSDDEVEQALAILQKVLLSQL